MDFIWNSIWILSYFRHWYKVIIKYLKPQKPLNQISDIHYIIDGLVIHKKVHINFDKDTFKFPTNCEIIQLTYYGGQYKTAMKLDFFENHLTYDMLTNDNNSFPFVEILLGDLDITDLFKSYWKTIKAPWEDAILISDILRLNSIKFNHNQELEFIDHEINSTFIPIADFNLKKIYDYK